MSRDLGFGKGVLCKGLYNHPSPEELDAIKPLVPVSDGPTEFSSICTPLTSKHHFRLLKILPGTDGATLQCHLYVCSICDNLAAYEALSYT